MFLGGLGVFMDPGRSYHFTKKYFLSRLIFLYRIIIIIIIITQHKSRTTCPIPNSCFEFIFTIQSYPVLQMATCWICIS